ncbi:hypothetical protein M8C21_001729, partial [Ambrosia artemisiifolia]
TKSSNQTTQHPKLNNHTKPQVPQKFKYHISPPSLLLSFSLYLSLSSVFTTLSNNISRERERVLHFEAASMAFLSFVGRVLFVSVFVFSAYQEFNDFGVDGGSAATALTPKLNVLSKHFTTHTGFQVPEFEIKFLVAGAIALKALGSFLFIFGNSAPVDCYSPLIRLLQL